ncbi:hypothetical protein [Thermogutta sp.]|uniref:hypothetical protein n=1 Tax=Thermogutta sp. TaxID=1962930 RepID=UPI0032205332
MEARELGFDTSLETEEMSLPRIRLVQALSPEAMEGSAKPGDYILPDGSRVSEIVGVLLGVRRCRYYRTAEGLMCSSIGATIGTGDPGGECAQCELAKWSVREEGERVPPACTLTYEYLLTGSYGVAVLSISTKSAGHVASQLNTQIHLFGAGTVEVTLGTQLVQRPNRRYYIPRVLGFRPVGRQLPDGSSESQAPEFSGSG